MPKQVQRTEMNSFLGGLATEYTSLNSPPNTASTIQNFELNRDGRVNRRLGMDFEPGYGYHSTGYPTANVGSLGFNSFKWETVGGNPTINFTVFQVGTRLFFFNADVINFSGTGFVDLISLDRFDGSVTFSMDSVEGRLVVVSGSEYIAVVTYNGTFNISYEHIQTRDYWGIEETVDPNCETDPTWRPLDNQQHRYNLMNQSWGIPRKDKDGNLNNPIDLFMQGNDSTTQYIGPWWNTAASTAGQMVPSNSEEVWTGMQMQPVAITSVSTQEPWERMYRNLYDDSLGSKYYSAKGYFIIDALNRGASRQAAVTQNQTKYPSMSLGWNFPSDYTAGGPSCVAQFAGRFWYGGFTGNVIGGDARSPNFTNYLFFSQLIKSSGDIIKCYQDGDPTSRDSSDVIDTDGGFVRVSGAQQIVQIRQLGTSLLIFATNGVWLLTGGTVDSGFSATNYKISQISTYGITSINSLVIEGDVAFFWAKDGIYQVARNQLGDFGVSSITLKTIQKFYQAIPSLSKQSAFGQYDEVNKKLRWIWTEGTRFDESQAMYELVLDTSLNAFTTNLFANNANNAISMGGIFQTRITGSTSEDVNVIVGTNVVYVNSDIVEVGGTQEINNVQYLRYFTLVDIGGTLNITVAYLNQAQWRDWASYDGTGVDAYAYLETGAQTAGDSSTTKWMPYITFSFIRTENGADADGTPLYPSSMMFYVAWAFGNQTISNKIPPLMQGYRYRKGNYTSGGVYDTGFELIQTRNKLRGSGRAFNLHIETEPYKDLQLLGWNISLSANQFS